MKKKNDKMTPEKLGAEIRTSYDRWHYLYEHGGSDPFWPDGTNLHLVRNHIIHAKRKCEELLKPEEYPEEYFALKIPDELPFGYMADPDGIRKRAHDTLERFEKSEDYHYLVEKKDRLTKDQKQKCSIENVIGYLDGLKRVIAEDDLVGMRRFGDATRYMTSFSTCRKNVEKMINEEPKFKLGQLSLFDFGI